MRGTETGTGKVYQNIINEITVPRLQINTPIFQMNLSNEFAFGTLESSVGQF